ncbi:deoxyguanosinetriphosphate triphosphohydrolase family protein [Methanosphaerula subterraneus]|uniref:deoxyguanosinetriphosphate triphosphohydrolase family protein n=1 Tax=Methanosphaerula subterraneus TaxID=3350244 RepID=UPI003F8474E7
MKLNPEITKKLSAKIKYKEQDYSDHATRDSDYLRRKNEKPEEPTIRPPFFRDADRILHSRAYTRYIDKTQVFFLVENDHITHRVLHVQLVSKIARTIGRALGLNEDLIEAISLGHDIGHVPYGHLGESCLSKLCEKNGIGPFKHNVQSVQFLDTIEDYDLTIQALDGILCHNGEVNNKSLKPQGTKDWNSFDSKIKKIQYNDKAGKIFPLTYEGCVVRFADNIAYLGRDLQDAFEVNLIDKKLFDEIKNLFPKNCKDILKGKNWNSINWLILDIFIKDLINNSYEQDAISFSDEISNCATELKKYNYQHIYHNPLLLKQNDEIENKFNILFKTFLTDLDTENKKSKIYEDMLNLSWISEKYRTNPKPTEIVRDYIAGMTDRYFETIYMQINNSGQIDNLDKYKGKFP